MGNCFSVDPDLHIWAWVDSHVDVAQCDRCNTTATKTWNELSPKEKARDWRVVVLEHACGTLARGASSQPGAAGSAPSVSPVSSPRTHDAGPEEEQVGTPFLLMCAPCSEAYQKELEQFKKERQYYAQAKGMLYPKQRLRTALRRIQTDESWDNTASFHATYRPNSTLDGLGGECLACGVGDVDTILSEEDITLVEEDTIEYEDEAVEEATGGGGGSGENGGGESGSGSGGGTEGETLR